jgi:type IV pilus assembly protein PilV
MNRQSQSGSVLLEALISILIFSFGIIALMGMQAVSMKNTTQAKARIDASFIAGERLGLMWVDQANLASYVEADTPIADLPDGKRTTAVNADQVTVTVTWQMPADTSPNSYRTIARINTNPP